MTGNVFRDVSGDSEPGINRAKDSLGPSRPAHPALGAPRLMSEIGVPAMQASPVPDLTSRGRLLASAVIVMLVAGLLQAIGFRHLLDHGMVDTDDAMRLVMVRSLLAGHGWFNEHVARLQPPLGVIMHWSRLIDGGIASLILLFRTVASRPTAEFLATTLWPVLWIFPAALSALVVARRLGGKTAVFIAFVFLPFFQPAFTQFRPGRIDHDNVQIALFMVATAGTMAFDRSRWGALAAGVGTALALNIGIEALPLAALLGAYLGLRVVFDPALARPVQRYALALALTAAAVYLAQTAPALWGVPRCDQIAVNLVAGLAMAGSGLVLLGALAARLPGPAARLAMLAAVGAAALGTYLGIHPSCLRGPFADIDPRLFSLWLDHVQEMMSLPAILRANPVTALALATGPAAALVATALVLLRTAAVRRDPAWLLAAVLQIVAAAITVYAIRNGSYAMWLGLPAMAAALVHLGVAGRPARLVRTAAAACVFSPVAVTYLAMHVAAGTLGTSSSAVGQPLACTAKSSFAALAAEPPGTVVGDIDLGPFILLYTHDSAESAPYHRLGPGILAAHAVMAARPGAARKLVSRGGYAYVAHCASPAGRDKDGQGDSLAASLARGEAPDWLAPVSDAGSLRIYRVRWAKLVGLRS